MRPKAAAPQLKSFQCRNCGGSIQLRSTHTKHVACPFCGSIVDAADPNLALIEKYTAKLAFKPLIPLGKRGTIKGEPFEMIGYLRRTVTIEGTNYTWEEYLLHHPHRGFRWLAHYGGHWNYISNCAAMPRVRGNEVHYLDLTFKKFQEAEARVTYVLGEFFWEIRRGEKSQCCDFISPPYILSSEKYGNEITWTIGEYLRPEDLWKGFALEGTPPAQTGVGPSQPSPFEASRKPMRRAFWALFGALILFQLAVLIFSQNRVAHSTTFSFDSAEPEHARVSEVFELMGRNSNVEITTQASGLANNWAELEMALINEETGESFDLTREVSYYSGVASGVDEGTPWTEHWVEDEMKDRVIVPSVPAGRYYLWFQPKTSQQGHVTSTVTVKRDVPRWPPFFLGLVAICLPYWIYLWRRRSFEYRRWLESDYPMPGFANLGASHDE